MTCKHVHRTWWVYMLLGSWLKSISAKGLFFYIQRRKILPYMEENSYNTEMCASDWSPLKRNCKVGFFVGGGGTKQFVWALDKYVTKPQLGHSFSCGISLSLLPNVAKQVFSFLELVFYQQRWMKTDKKQIWYFSWGKGGVEPNEKRVISWKSHLANGCKPLRDSFCFIECSLPHPFLSFNFALLYIEETLRCLLFWTSTDYKKIWYLFWQNTTSGIWNCVCNW